MKYSTDRILTTHGGALPMAADLKDLHNARAAGTPVDEQAFSKRVTSAVADIVKKQIACGIDIINDGEQGKSNFSRYARDRLSGFIEREVKASDHTSTIYARDLTEFSDYFNARTFHRGDNVTYPVKLNGQEKGRGRFTAKAGEDYCWMWTARRPTRLTGSLGPEE